MDKELAKKDLELDSYKLDFLKYKEENDDLLQFKNDEIIELNEDRDRLREII